MKKTNILFICVATVIAILFVLIPCPPADLILRLSFDEITGDYCSLYYTTDYSESFSDEQCIVSPIDSATKQVTFRLDSSLEDHITGMRLDFPVTDDLICVKSITVSSAGVIQEEYNPCHFFADANIALSNDAEITLVKPRNRAYIAAGGNDPFLILSESLTNQILNCYSHFRLTRLCICLFAVGCYLFARKNLFSKKKIK